MAPNNAGRVCAAAVRFVRPEAEKRQIYVPHRGAQTHGGYTVPQQPFRPAFLGFSAPVLHQAADANVSIRQHHLVKQRCNQTLRLCFITAHDGTLQTRLVPAVDLLTPAADPSPQQVTARRVYRD